MLVGIVLAGAMVLSVMPSEFWQRMDTITSYEEKQEGSALGRLHFWSVAVEMARENPLLGVGFLGYNNSYDAYDFSYGEFGKSRAVHSAWFGVLAELGYPGLILYVANLVLGLWSCGKVRRLAARHPSCEDLGKYAVAVETSLVVFAVGSSFLSFQYNEVYWHMIGISIALANIATARMRAPATENALQSAQRLEVAAA
jgi:O-antigen ligase